MTPKKSGRTPINSDHGKVFFWHIPAIVGQIVDGRAATRPKSRSGETSTTKNGEGGRIKKAIPCGTID